MSFHPRWSSVQVKCSSECRTGTFLPKIPHNFYLKTRGDKRTITLFSGNPVFIKLSSVDVKCTFGNCDDDFAWKKHFFLQISKLMKKLRIDRKKIIKLCSGDAKWKFVKSEAKRLSEVKNSCALNPKTFKKRHVPPRIFFCFQKNSLHI